MESTSNRIGKIAEKFILKYLEDHGGEDIYVCRLIDTYDANAGRWGDSSQKKVIVKRRPCDAILIIDGTTYFCEIKATTNKTGITSSLFSQQTAERTRIKKAGGRYIYLVYSVAKEKWYWVNEPATAAWESLEFFSCSFPKVPL